MQSARAEPPPTRRRLPRPNSRLLLAIPLLAIGAIGLVRWQQRSPIAEYPLADRSSVPTAIAVGPDGTAWFTTSSGDPVGAVRDGRVEMAVRGSANIVSTGIAFGPVGNIWYTDDQRRTINRVAPDGSRAQLKLPTGVSSLGGVTAD